MPIVDAHTHLSGSEFGENPDNIIQTLEACGVHKAFVFAPLLDGGIVKTCGSACHATC
jgi:Tat protein secretion system quality control protein TatD with DNase activity